MKKTTYRELMLSALAGSVLALVVAFSSVGLTQKVSADDYCVPPPGCGTWGCFARGDGVKSCKNYNLQGGSCSSNSCKASPVGDGGGLDEPVAPPEN